MSSRQQLPLSATHLVRDSCLCLHVQRAARGLARRFDDVFRPLDLTHGQFSLLMSLNRPEPPTIGSVAALLAVDRTMLTAVLKPLERRRLVKVSVDKEDKRSRRLTITASGRSLLAKAFPLWRDTHAAIDRLVAEFHSDDLRAALRGLSERASHLRTLFCRHRDKVIGKSGHGLRKAFVSTVFSDDARTLFGGGELAVPGQQGLTVTEVLERHRLRELHGFDVITAVMAIDDAFRRDNFSEGDAVLIVAAVGSMHDEAPYSARTKIIRMRCCGETVRSPPLREMLRVGPHRKHQCARRVEHARADDRTRIPLDIDALFYGHYF